MPLQVHELATQAGAYIELTFTDSRRSIALDHESSGLIHYFDDGSSIIEVHVPASLETRLIGGIWFNKIRERVK